MMAHSLLEAHWRYDADLSNHKILGKMAADLGHDADTLMEQAASEAVQDKLQENSIWAREQDVFGSPTYIVDGDPFYGQDHLGLVKRALSQPFAASTWSNPPVD
jgi:2-hydroxychromene-2-carboxylate isomerase